MPKKQKFPHLLGSKWTATQKTWGWRHFQVVNRKNEGQLVFAEMVASCDSNVRFWLNAQQLKNRSLWQPGWQSTQELEVWEDAGERGGTDAETRRRGDAERGGTDAETRRRGDAERGDAAI